MTPDQALERARILLTLKYHRKALVIEKIRYETGLDDATIATHAAALEKAKWITIAGNPTTFKYRPRYTELLQKRGVSTKATRSTAQS